MVRNKMIGVVKEVGLENVLLYRLNNYFFGRFSVLFEDKLCSPFAEK